MQDKIQNITSAASYAASGISTAVGFLTVNDIAAIFGIILGIATFATNFVLTLHFKRKHYKLAEKLSKPDR